MAKGFAIHHALTDHGGMIPSTQMRSSQMGHLFVRAGDGHFCPKCKCWSTVVKSHDHIIFDDKAVAYVGDQLTCGAMILPQQNHVVGDSGGAATSAISNLQSTSRQQNQTNSFTQDEGKYEIYYIEQDNVDYLKFKNLIYPYKGEIRSILGMGTQAITGVCDFIITYILKGKKLYVAVSYVPPRLSIDAKVFPFESLHLYIEKNQAFEFILSKKLTMGEPGYWDNSKGKEPVGACEIILPEPNLSIIKAELKLGYEAQFDEGTIYPIPSYMTHTFSLISAARVIK